MCDMLSMHAAAVAGDGAVEITFNYVTNSSTLCRHYGLLDVHSGKLTCYCPSSYVLAADGVSCVGRSVGLSVSSLHPSSRMCVLVVIEHSQ